MRRIAGLVLGLLVLAPAGAQAGDVWSLRGRCTELRAAGHDFTSGCVGKVVNANNDNGAVAFIFTVRTGALIVFTGDGDDQVAAGNVATQPVSEVTFSLGIQGVADNHIRAAGTCKYGNPFAGVAQVTCTASTKDGEFSAKFTSNGQKPQPGY